MINQLAEQIHKNNVEKGFYEEDKNIGEMLALIHSEVSEALEADRKGKYANLSLFESFGDFTLPPSHEASFQSCIKDTFEDEIADAMIRLMDLAGYKGIDLDKHIKYKVKYNTMRDYKHGKSY